MADAYLLLEVGEHLFGLDLSLIESVIPYRAPDAVPFQRPETMGGLLYRGQFMGVVDLSLLLGLSPLADEGRAVIAVACDRGAYLGFVAAASKGLLRKGQIEDKARVIGKWEGPFHVSSVKIGEKVAHLLDFSALVGEVSRKVERDR